MIRSWSLRAKLTTMGLFVALLAATSGAIGYFFLRRVSYDYSIVANENLPALKELAELRSTIRELRIHVRSIGLAGNTQQDVLPYMERSKQQIEKFEQHIAAYQKIDPSAQDRSDYKEFITGWNDFKAFGGEILKLSQNFEVNKEEVGRLIREVCAIKAEKVYQPLLKESNYQIEFADKSAQAAKAEENKAESLVILFASASILLAGIVSLWASSYFSKVIKAICDSLANTSVEVHQAATSLSQASTTVHDGSTDAAEMLGISTAAITQIESTVKVSNEKALQAKVASENSKKSAEDGSEAVQQLMASMGKINDSSKKMQEIINIIEDISFQTNLLALNAAVEAARAGEAGRGFAVVAEAVRSLAQRSSVSAKEISDLISESAAYIEEGVTKAELNQDVLNRILKSIEQVSAFNQDIAHSSEEQSLGIQQVSTALLGLDTTSQANTKASEEVSNIARNLNDKTETVESLISDLRTLVEGTKAA